MLQLETAPSWFSFSITSWKLTSWQVPTLGFGLNQTNLTLPPWSLLVSLPPKEAWECWRKTSWVGSIFCFCGSPVLLVEILVLTAHSLCTTSILPISGCSKRILLSQMPEGSINQGKQVSSKSRAVYLQPCSKSHNALSRLVNRRVSSLHKGMITRSQMSACDPRKAGVNLGPFGLLEEPVGVGMLFWLPGSPHKLPVSSWDPYLS